VSDCSRGRRSGWEFLSGETVAAAPQQQHPSLIDRTNFSLKNCLNQFNPQITTLQSQCQCDVPGQDALFRDWHKNDFWERNQFDTRNK
jgi:hypothetical protein